MIRKLDCSLLYFDIAILSLIVDKRYSYHDIKFLNLERKINFIYAFYHSYLTMYFLN